MELVIKHRTQNELELEIKGEDHTLLNLLNYFLIEDPRVEFSSYEIKFPGITHPVLYLRVSPGNDPFQVLKDVASKIIDYCNQFQSKFKDELKIQAVMMLGEMAKFIG